MELLNRENTGLLVIDVQQKLMEVMRQKQGITENIIKLLHLSKLFNLPVILTEHYPRWLGPTLKEIQEFLPTYDTVHVPQDAVDSRTDDNWRVGLGLLREAGAFITSTETIIYQILKKAGTKEFKKMMKILK
jgi:hypothetical protein